MTSRGVVREWHDEEGWGVIDSPDTPGGCWAHVTMVMVNGFATLRVDQDVEFTFEPADQDGFTFRAEKVWPAGQQPVDVDSYESGLMWSSLTLIFNDPQISDEGGLP